MTLVISEERYLGMWKDDQRHDKGCQIAIDGVFHEGIFDRNRFTVSSTFHTPKTPEF